MHQLVANPGGDSSPALQLVNVTKWYGAMCAVDSLSFDVSRGEIVGFVGPNGAGKSTTLRLLMGLTFATSGRALILGEDALNGRPAVRARVGYLPGSPALYPRMTSRQCLTFLARVRGVDCASRVAELAHRLDVDLDKHIHDLSRGNKQKTALIAALMHRPDVLLLDEPTSGLDPLVQREVERILREEAARGVAVLLSSHVLSEVEALADRVVMLDRGRAVLTASMTDISRRLSQRLTFEFNARADSSWLSGAPGVHHVEAFGNHIDCTVDGSQSDVLSRAANHAVVSVHSHERRLEDVFSALIGDRAA